MQGIKISPMRPSTEAQPLALRTAFVFLALFAAVALAYFFLDREVATALRPYFNGVPFFKWLTYIVKPLTPAASIAAIVVSVRALSRGSLTSVESAILRMCCAILIAGVLTYELKEIFGRTWPETWVNNNPSYFGNGTYGFFPFHGGQGYASFPSGHTTAISALAGAIWCLWPGLRWIGLALAAAVVIGLLGADYHWLSDIIAGAIVGGSTGVAAAKIAPYEDGA